MSTPIRVVLADDQRLFREGLQIILDAARDITVVGVAADGLEAIELAQSYQPDVILLDIRMPRCDGIAAIVRIKAIAPDAKIALLTTHDMPQVVVEGMEAGAIGFLLKESSAEELCMAVRALARGQVIVQGQSAAQLLAGLAQTTGSHALHDFGLTERERDVLRLLASGQTNGEIATALIVSETTIKTHINHIFAKLGVHDRTQAVLLAQRNNLA